MKLRLSDIKVGVPVRIVEIDKGDLRAKLLEMGLLKEREVIIAFKAPLGDPIAVEIEGSLLALRLEEASCITVETLVD
ncbi:MAG: FeoA family protein [Bacteroidota bacterium]